jgi:hypothetical protein
MKILGLDLGQKHDPTAIAVAERLERVSAYSRQVEFLGVMVRHVERVQLGTPYPMVVERVRTILSQPCMSGPQALVVDATGVGTPVVDMLRSAGLGCEIVAVTITNGERESQAGQGWHVPKRDLMAGLQVLLESGELKIAGKMKHRASLVRELVDVQMTRSGMGMRIGADRAGQHDDLVIAVALAVWKGKQKRPMNRLGTTRLF